MVELQPSKLVMWVRFPSPAHVGYAEIAQPAEHNHGKVGVRGSIPRLGSEEIKNVEISMKGIVTIILSVFLMTSVAFAAEEALTANLTLSSTIGSECPASAGKGTQAIIWGGVKDNRASKAVGVLKKGNDETDVVSKEPVEKLLNDGMKTLFEKCGYTVATGAANGVRVGVGLDEFFAGAKKGLIMGETEAKGSMTITLTKGGRSVDLQFGESVQNKGLKKKNIKKLEQSLSEVLASMINKVASSNQFAEAMKDLGK